jgi:hypothetical protein
MRIPSEALPEAVEKVEPLAFAQKTDVHRWLAHDGHSATVHQTGPVNRARVDGRAPVWPTILPFSGGCERERSDRRARPSATAGWTARRFQELKRNRSARALHLAAGSLVGRATVDSEVGELLRANVIFDSPGVIADRDDFGLGTLGRHADARWNGIDEHISMRAPEEAQILSPIPFQIGPADLLPSEEREQGEIDVCYLVRRDLPEPGHPSRLP